MYLTGAIEAPVQASNDLWQVSVVASVSKGMSEREVVSARVVAISGFAATLQWTYSWCTDQTRCSSA